MTNLIIREFNGKKIRHREDGFMSLTDMCQAQGKLLGNWGRLDSTKEYLKVLQDKHYGGSHNGPIEVRAGGDHSTGLTGTWGDRHVAIRLAQWLSPQFAIQVNEWALDAIDHLYQDRCRLEASFLESLLSSTTQSHKPGFVYALLDEGNARVKIGMTSNPLQRLKTLQAGDSSTLQFVGLRGVESVGLAKIYEKYLHDLFADDQLLGEWFNASLLMDYRIQDFFNGSNDFTTDEYLRPRL